MDPRSESPMESRVRVLLVTSGLPRPEAQLEIWDVGEFFVARADLGYPEQRVVVEYDGAWHWKQRRADDRRRDRMRALGWIVIVVSADDYFKMPWSIVAQVRNALERAA
jgi:very-short-patch-repair endonuclease